MKKIFLFATLSLALVSCKNSSEKEETKTADSIQVPVQQNQAVADLKSIETPGIIGIIEIPEILTLAIKDSASQADAGFKMGKAYGAIEADMIALNVSNNEMPPGALFYNNDPKNLVFECVVPITEMPKKQPKNSTIVVLEATRAVVYNYYGPYDKMFDAYAEIKKYLEQNKLEQSGVAREFYLSDATVEKDPAKWLSKIYIPVK